MANQYEDRTELLSILGHAESVLQGHRSYAYTVLSLIGASELVLIADISNKDGWFTGNNWSQVVVVKIAVLLVLAVYNFAAVQRFRKNIYRFNFRVSVVEMLLSAVSTPGWPKIQKEFQLAFDLKLFNIFRLITTRFNFETNFSFWRWFFLPFGKQDAAYVDSKSIAFAKNPCDEERFAPAGLDKETREKIAENFGDFIVKLKLVANGKNRVWSSPSDDFLGNVIFRMFALLAFNSIFFVMIFTLQLAGLNCMIFAEESMPYVAVVALIFLPFPLLPIIWPRKNRRKGSV